jgi:hypothetical protein
MAYALYRTRRYVEWTRKALLLCIVGCVLLILPVALVFAPFLFAIAVGLLFIGRKGFGRSHARAETVGLVATVALTIALLTLVVFPYMGMAGLVPEGFGTPFAVDSSVRVYGGAILLFLTGSIFFVMMYRLLNRQGRTLMALAWILSSLTGLPLLLQQVAGLQAAAQLAPGPRAQVVQTQIADIIFQGLGIATAGPLLWALVFYLAYRRVTAGDAIRENRLKEAERYGAWATGSPVGGVGGASPSPTAVPSSGLSCDRCHGALPVGTATCPTCGASVW